MSDRSGARDKSRGFRILNFAVVPSQREARARVPALPNRADTSAVRIVREIGITLLVPLIGAFIVALILNASSLYEFYI